MAQVAAPGRVRRYNLGSVDRIPRGEGRQFLVGRSVIAVFHARDGRLFATQADCPHRGGPLADGMVGATQVICPLHGFLFDLITGKPYGNDCPALRTYSVEVASSGDLMVTVPG